MVALYNYVKFIRRNTKSVKYTKVELLYSSARYTLFFQKPGLWSCWYLVFIHWILINVFFSGGITNFWLMATLGGEPREWTMLTLLTLQNVKIIGDIVILINFTGSTMKTVVVNSKVCSWQLVHKIVYNGGAMLVFWPVEMERS